jgi:predicted dehydrogenase
MGDTFADRAHECLQRLQAMPKFGSRIKVTPDRVFPAKDPDFDNYKHVIDSGVDVVILATPPHFRPQHLAYAIEKGKHCFVEKPVGVDVPGVKSVQETCAKAKEKNLAIVSGLVWRADPGVTETVKRVRDGAIGDIIAIQSCYNAGTLWHRDPQPGQSPWSRMEYQVRNWLYYTWLSGDHITEQAIHSLDKVNWLLGDVSPASAVGMGGRQQRTDPKWGHIYDHHTVFYDFPNGVKAFFTCKQQDNTANFVDEIVLGTKGRAQILAKKIEGPSKWRYRGGSVDAYMLEHVNLFQSIRNGEALNQGHYMCNSTLVSIMGRMCTYTGQQYSWDQLMASTERLGPEKYEWTDVPEPPVAVPGATKIA